MKSVGIIGAGQFGIFLAQKLEPFFDIKIYSRRGAGERWNSRLEDVAACDFVIPSIPLDSYQENLQMLKPHLGKDSVIVDVCSVKSKPVRLINELLPNQPMVATHPLFGPQSASKSLAGHIVVLCPEVSSQKQAYQQIKVLCRNMGLEVLEMSADEHDSEMAVVQGLTFFIARTLKQMSIHQMRLSTPSFKRLLHLAELEQHHSEELFYTIQSGNSKTSAIREKFVRLGQALNKDIQKHS